MPPVRCVSPRLPLEGKLSAKLTDEVSLIYPLLFPPHPTSLTLGHLPLKGKAFFLLAAGSAVRVLRLPLKGKASALRCCVRGRRGGNLPPAQDAHRPSPQSGACGRMISAPAPSQSASLTAPPEGEPRIPASHLPLPLGEVAPPKAVTERVLRLPPRGRKKQDCRGSPVFVCSVYFKITVFPSSVRVWCPPALSTVTFFALTGLSVCSSSARCFSS